MPWRDDAPLPRLARRRPVLAGVIAFLVFAAVGASEVLIRFNSTNWIAILGSALAFGLLVGGAFVARSRRSTGVGDSGEGASPGE